MNKHFLIIIFLLVVIFLPKIGIAQEINPVEIFTHKTVRFAPFIYNYATIQNNDGSIIPIENIKLFFKNEEYKDEAAEELFINRLGDKYMFQTNGTGTLYFQIEVNDSVIIKQFEVTPLTAIFSIGGYTSDSKDKIKAARLKAQLGLTTYSIDNNIQGKCEIDSFELIRISKNGNTFRSINKGNSFSDESSTIINLAMSGDIYIFRKIYYKCGNTTPLRADDIMVEVE